MIDAVYAGSDLQLQAVLELAVGQCPEMFSATSSGFHGVQRALGDDLVIVLCKVAEFHRHAVGLAPVRLVNALGGSRQVTIRIGLGINQCLGTLVVSACSIPLLFLYARPCACSVGQDEQKQHTICKLCTAPCSHTPVISGKHIALSLDMPFHLSNIALASSALHLSAYQGDAAVIKRLIQAEQDVNAKDGRGHTAKQCAAQASQRDAD